MSLRCANNFIAALRVSGVDGASLPLKPNSRDRDRTELGVPPSRLTSAGDAFLTYEQILQQNQSSIKSSKHDMENVDVDASKASSSTLMPLLVSEGDDISVPLTDVAATWDSTLDASFSPYCEANTEVHLTPSERACAASHLRVWRSIARLRQCVPALLGRKQAPTVPSTGQSITSPREQATADELSIAAAQVYACSFYGGGWKLRSPAPAQAPSSSSLSSKLSSTAPALPSTPFSPRAGSAIVSEDIGDWYLVLEDDAKFVQAASSPVVDFAAVVTRIVLDKVPPDFDIVYLGHVIPSRALQQSAGARRSGIVKVNYAWKLHAYVLRGRAVEMLLQRLPICAPVDKFIAQLIHENYLQVHSIRLNDPIPEYFSKLLFV